MASDSHLIVKCPACGFKFKAERQLEASVVVCSSCQAEIRLSGIDESRRKQAAKLPRIRNLPEKHDEPTRLAFQDLARHGSSRTQAASPAETSGSHRLLKSTEAIARKRRERARQRAVEDTLEAEAVETEVEVAVSSAVRTAAASADPPRLSARQDPRAHESETDAPGEDAQEAGEWKRRKFFLFDQTPGWEGKGETKRRRRKGDRAHHRIRMLARILVAAVLLSAGALVLWQSFHNPAETDGDSVNGSRPEATVMERFNASAPVIEAFLRAKSIDEMLPHVRNPEAVRPLMERHYGLRGVEPTPFSRIGPLEESSIVNGFLVTPVYTSGFRALPIGVDHSDPPRVDWESFVAYCEVPIGQFRSARPSAPTLLRVRLRPDSFYDGEFDDPDLYASFRITGADEKAVFWGYLRRDSPAYSKLLSENVGTGQEEFLATIRAHYPASAAAAAPEDPSAARIIIDDFLTTGWILRD
ncbi:MAG TPA: hypothetical protein VMN36_18780 [Verrucomicrobiales bacterium]|nr:hypothetical protein [Verrucomicrobiales bacterium]